jgi:ABC-2 type transport system permease protein
MTSDMNIFKIHTKKGNEKLKVLLPILIAICFMFAIWSYAHMFFEKLAPLHLQYVVLSLFVFITSLMTIIEGVYKAGPLMFNCKDDQLLLSLPIKRRTVLFVRLFKFYIFELLFNSLFIIPLIIAYIRWAEVLNWTFFLTSFVMILLLPIIPIIISAFIGAITTSLASRFKHKNTFQIVISFVVVLGIMFLSMNIDKYIEYLIQNVTSINELITKIYYPAGAYADLVMNFKVSNLLLFVLINIVIFVLGILVMSRFYFKINSRLKQVSTNKNKRHLSLRTKSKSVTSSLVKKELNTFFSTPVFVINAGFGLVLFLIATIIISFKFDSVIWALSNTEGMNFPIDLVTNNLSILVLGLVAATAFMTSITSSVISIEGRNINILKSLPVSTKTILMSKIYSCLMITTPVLLLGDIILCIKLKISIIESLLLLLLSVLIPLISHFIGLIVNLKFPKLDAENSTEIVKQSMSSFVSVMVGMLLFIVSVVVIVKIIGKISSVFILLISVILFVIINVGLYLYLINKSVKDFNGLSI